MTAYMWDGLDRYGASADLDLRYIRTGATFSATAGVNGGGAIRITTGNLLQLKDNGSLSTLSGGGVLRKAWWSKTTLNGGLTNNSRHMQFYTNLQTVANGGANGPIVGINSNGSVYVSGHGSTTVLATSATGVVISGQYHHWKYAATYADAGGSIKVWVDNVLVVDFSGDTLTGTQPSEVRGFRMDGGNHATTDFDDPFMWDDAGSDFTGEMSDYHDIEERSVDGETSTQFTSGPSSNLNFNNVSDAAFHDGDTTFVESETVGDRDVYTVANLSVNPSVIYGVGVDVVSRKTDAGGVTMRPLLRSGATTGEGGDKTQTTSYARYQHFWGKDPDTAAAFSVSGVNAVQPGIKYQA